MENIPDDLTGLKLRMVSNNESYRVLHVDKMSDKAEVVRQLIEFLGVGVIIFDEIQHIDFSANNR